MHNEPLQPAAPTVVNGLSGLGVTEMEEASEVFAFFFGVELGPRVWGAGIKKGGEDGQEKAGG